ncbi:hypothetical protein UFOVP1295_51 [uncultured Caudovirales phage]|uniref:Uncharacterized protein n=1 Tax=uncultured Caudovirales phage TaxID=2100421 RepID=A0A6J5RVP1_9CAUD|nr:hypothetical protein UFOVP1295_51 [uncultured Caudovirales phage]
MAITTFQGPVRSLNGFYTQGPGSVITLPNATNTITLDVATYAGRAIYTNDATLVITLPSLNATADPVSSGPGSDPNTVNNMGASFTFVVGTAATAWKIITATSQYLVGSLLVIDTDTTDTVKGFAANGTTIRSVNLDGSTTGGIVGSYVTVTALNSTMWAVSGVVIGSGVVATPFATS